MQVFDYYFGGKPPLELGVRQVADAEKYKDCSVRWISDKGSVEDDCLLMWLREIGVDFILDKPIDYLMTNIRSEVDQWHEKTGFEGKKVRLISQKFSDYPEAYQIPVLYYKLCKDGMRIKLALNVGKAVGEGSSVRTYAIPVVTIDEEGKVVVKSKALLSQMAQEFSTLQYQMDKFYRGTAIQRRALAIFKEMGWGKPTVAPVPKSVYHGSGLFSQSFFPINFWKFARSMSIGQRLQVLEDVALAVAAVDKAGAAHLDVRPPNIMVTQEGRGRLIDFNAATVYGKVMKTLDQDFPYRGELWKKHHYFVATKGADICGLARTLIEACLGVKWNQRHDALLDEKQFLEATRDLAPLELQLAKVAKKMLSADRTFFTRFMKEQQNSEEELNELIQEVFQDCDALWCADELRRIRLEFFPSSEEKRGYFCTSEPGSSQV